MPTFHRYGTSQQFPLFKKEYVHLYVNVVREAVLAVDKSRYFMISSPSNGLQSDNEGYVSSHPYDPLYGDGKKQSSYTNFSIKKIGYYKF